jgi:hypothetical protein
MKNKKVAVGIIAIAGTLFLSGCTKIDDMGKDWAADSTGLPRVITVYSKTGDVLKKYERDNVRTSVDSSGQVKINLDGKRIQVLNADVVVEEK